MDKNSAGNATYAAGNICSKEECIIVVLRLMNDIESVADYLKFSC